MTYIDEIINSTKLKINEYIKNYTVPIDTKEYTSFDYKTKWEEGMSGDGVRAAKERLYLLRYYIGETDSDNYSVDAVEAVKDFQEKNGLFPYGVLDITTQVKIENEFAKLEAALEKIPVHGHRGFSEQQGGSMTNWGKKQ